MLFYKNKKVLVTGASGFIGSNLTKVLLREGAIVNALSLDQQSSNQKNLNLFTSDINDIKTLQKAVDETEVIFHLAGQVAIHHSNKNPFDDFDTNLNGLISLLKVVKNQKIVFPSSSAVYTPTKQPTLLEENSRVEPTNFYALSKYASELYLKNFFKHHSIKSTTLRLSYIYGQNLTRGVLYDILSQINKSSIGLFMNPHNRLDFVHVDDVVEAMLLSGLNKSSDGEIINISSGKGIKVLDIINQLNKNIKITSLTDKPFTQEDAISLVLDNKKAEKILNWKPKKEFYKSLEDIYKSFKNENIKS